ncbi:MAG TPA: inorganic diphosphatase [Lachnospiraceae bacterium]|nr:inorganic diphosphatase [Lachnospiraceae bacterium]
MIQKKQNNIHVIGHKNPDTDSICSAIAYANLKNHISDQKYVASRAGQINNETQFVLDYFKVKAPKYIPDVRPQVQDIYVRETEGISNMMSLKKAWDYSRAEKIVTLPIIKEDKTLEGLITISDIATADMDVYDAAVLSRAKTPFRNIVETLGGEMIVGDIEEIYEKGKVIIAAANPDVMETYIEAEDIVILGNRYESQLSAIEMGAKCLIVCMGVTVSQTIQKLAQENNCSIIVTPYDTYTVARLINHSMPVGYFMTKDNLISFHMNDFTEDVQVVMAEKRFHEFPVLDQDEKYVGMVSRRSLISMEQKKLILVDHNERSQAVDGYETAEILEIIDHHRIGSIETVGPVYFRNQPVGCTCTIVTQMYRENNVEIEPHIAGLLCSAILSDTLMYRSPTCTPLDKATAEELAKIAGIDVESYAKQMFKAASNLKDKTAEEIFHQDFKKFVGGDTNFGVGQINAMSDEELQEIKAVLLPYMEESLAKYGVEMLFFMLTNILEESTELIFVGENAPATIEKAFHVQPGKDSAILEGVVSRKKQLIPPMMALFQ